MATWNPWHGCKKISPGCANCYVYRLSLIHILLSQCGDPQMELAQILEDEGYKAAIRGKIVDEGVAALLMNREPNWQGVMVADVYEEMLARKTAESLSLIHISVNIGGTNYEVQIIGFNHDDKVSGGKAAYSFQLMDCLNQTQDVYKRQLW